MGEIKISDYQNDLIKIKETIAKNQSRTIYAVNSAMIITYYRIGEIINKRVVWGNKYIKKLADGLKQFGRGYSFDQLRRMARFARELTIDEIWAQAVPKIPWTSIILIMNKSSSKEEMMWYFKQTVINSWSRSNITKQFQLQAYSKQQIAPLTNEPEKLNDIIRDTIDFDFISIRDIQTEHDLKNKLIDNIILFLQELGQGFSFIGKEYRLIGQNRKNYYVDLLMYHTKIHCYIVIEVKLNEIEPSDFGQLNFYINTINELEKTQEDNDTIGLLLCKSADNFEVQTTLKGITNPIGVSKYKVLEELPIYLEKRLKEIE